MEYRYTSREEKPLNLLVSPKDKDNIKKKSTVIYWFRCDKTDCEEEYIRESARTFEERYRNT